MVVDSLKGELVKFNTKDQVELQGFLCSYKKSKTALVHVHGMTSSLWSGTGMQMQEVAFKSKISFFSFNNRGLGGVNFFSGKKYGVYGTSYEKFKDCLDDIGGAISFLKKKGYKNFILSGHSTGCQKVAYYMASRNDKSVKAIILLAPADDLNYEKKRHGGKFYHYLKCAKRLVDSKKGDVILPKYISEYLFSAKRYYDLYKDNSLEGNIFNYEKPIKIIGKIKVPILAIFGKDEEFKVISPDEMLDKIDEEFRIDYSETNLINGNHTFSGARQELIKEVSYWVNWYIVGKNGILRGKR